MQQEIEKSKNRNSYTKFAGLFLGILIVALIIFIFTRRFLGNPQRSAMSALPDDVTLMELPSGNRFVNDKTGGYSFIIPGNWYFEKKEGSGVAVYPDYVPKNDTVPKCKIEISVFKNIAAPSMDNWVTSRIHKDPTIAIAETLRETFSVSGAMSAFEWRGTMDRVATTIAYISAMGNVYEIAPSVLDIQKTDGNTACDAGFKSFLNSISFKNNEK